MTHILSTLTIRNYKSIRNATFELSVFTPLVGYNNAGKSNILEAIKWLLRRTALSESSFYDTSQPVEIEGIISGITQSILEQLPANQRTSMQPFLIDESLSIKRVQPQPNVGVAQIQLLVRDPENVGTDDEWRTNPTGLDQAIQALFPEPIHIGAMENADEDVSKSKNTTTIGKLLAEIIGPIQSNYRTVLEDALDGIKGLLAADGVSRAAELLAFDTAVNTKVESFFPGINIKVHVPTPELKEVFSKGTIKVFEDSNPVGKDVSSLGHGAQRSIQMALIRHLADIKRDSGEQTSNTILLIDEPELYLHPQAIEILRDALKTLSNQGYQIIFSTHSPFLITSKDVENTLLIRKNDLKGTHRRNLLRESVRQIAKSARSQLELIFSLSHSSNILFSERVILAEGTTEFRLLPSIIQKITSKSLGLHKTALVSLGGSGSTRKAMSVLKMMDIPTKAIVDLDFALKHSEQDGFLDTGDPDIAKIKVHLTEIAETNSIHLSNGWPSNGSISAIKAFRILAKEESIQENLNSLKEKLKIQGIYIWTKGTIEDHLDNVAKNEAGWARFNSRLETDDLNVILPNDHIELNSLVEWLIS